MTRADKVLLPASISFCGVPKKVGLVCIWLSIFVGCAFTGCDRLMSSRYAQLVQDADGKSAQGDFERARKILRAVVHVRGPVQNFF